MPHTVLLTTIPIDENSIRQLGTDVSSIIARSSTITANGSEAKKVKDIIEALLDTAENAGISPLHRATTCITLCGAFERCQIAEAANVRNLIWEDKIWSRFFGIYLDLFDKAKAKSMRQVLLVSAGVLLKENTPLSLQFRDQVVLNVVSIISRFENHRRVKPALQALAHFLSKELISVDELIQLFSESSPDSKETQKRAKPCQILLARFLDWVLHHDTALSAGHLVAQFLAKAGKSQSFRKDQPEDLPLWVEPFENSLRASPESIQEFRHHVFPDVFRLNFDDYLKFLHHLGIYSYLDENMPAVDGLPAPADARPDDPVEINMLFAALQVGKEIGMVKDVDHATTKIIEVRGNVLLIPDVVFGRLLAHWIPEVRLAAISLLISSTGITKPMTRLSFQFLQENLFHLHADTDANFRGELLSQIQRLFDRLRSSTATLSKALAGNATALKTLAVSSVGRAQNLQTCEDALKDTWKYHSDFISWYISFLNSELRPTSSYQRHISALKTLYIIMKSGLDPVVSHSSLSKQAQGDKRWHHQLNILTPKLTRSLLDLLLDPFDEVHSVAASILRLQYEGTGITPQHPDRQTIPGITSSASPIHLKEVSRTELLQFIERAERVMLRTGRADHADGVARAYELLYSLADDEMSFHDDLENREKWWFTKLAVVNHLTKKLEKTLEVARQNLSVAVNCYPVHGILASIRFIIERPNFYSNLKIAPQNTSQAWKALHLRLYKAFIEMWDCVRDILCNDAPEGHVPDDIEEDSQITTKDILSYSWRALKESSTLLRAIVSGAPLGSESFSVLDIADFEKLGRLCFNQLIYLRHRGAFSAVAQAFAICCQRCCKVVDTETPDLLLSWYKETMLFIRDKSPIITRRSAGIPSVIIGVISAAPNGPLFQLVFDELFEEAFLEVQTSESDGSRIPQVHGLNCIKDIFTTTKLATPSEAYLSKGLDLAATKLGSEYWPIRNCGLMLFKALIERLLGTGDTQNWKDKRTTRVSRLSYTRFPNLLNIVIKSITLTESIAATDKMETANHGMEAVFPALQILHQAPPPSSQLDEIEQLVLELTKTPHWYIRDMAARTYVSGLRSHNFSEHIQVLMSKPTNNQNALHGNLLSLKYAFKTPAMLDFLHFHSDHISSMMEQFMNGFHLLYETNSNPFIRSAYIDSINEFSKASILARCESTPSALIKKVTDQIQYDFEKSVNDLLKKPQLGAVAGSALLRKSTSLYLINQQLYSQEASSNNAEEIWNQYTAVEGLLEDISASDPDNYCVVLEELIELIHKAPSDSLKLAKSHIVACIHKISLDAVDPEVKVASHTAMASLLLDQANKSSFFDNADPRMISQTLQNLENGSLYGPPMECEASLPIHGYFLDRKAQLLPVWDTELIQEIGRYSRIVSRALNDSNPITIRFAAARSLTGLYHLWTTPKSPSLLSLALQVYDALNDDDDEVRELTASVASRVINGSKHSPDTRELVPLLAAKKLAEHLASDYVDSGFLFEEAIGRFMNRATHSAPFVRRFQETLMEARRESSALFAEEKQNLFIDETREIAIWAMVLEHVDIESLRERRVPTISFPLISTEWPQPIKDFEHWVIDGIGLLTATTLEEIDGPLGWTSKPEVFTLGLRVIYGAKVMLVWAQKSREVADPSGKDSLTRKINNFLSALRNWRIIAKERDLHGIWLEQIDVALELGEVVELVPVGDETEGSVLST